MKKHLPEIETPVTIVVPVYNGEVVVENCIKSLLAISYPKELLQIIIVDNNSSDRTKEIINSYPVEYAFEKEPTSYAARNKGISLSKNEIIGFTDADCIVSHQWVTSAIEQFQKSESTCIVGGPILAYKPKTLVEMFLDSIGNNNSYISFQRGYFPTANLFIRKSTAVDLDGFDSSMKSGGDLDFCWRVKLHGGTLGWSDSSIVWHKHRYDLNSMYRQSYKYGFGSSYIIHKYKAHDIVNHDFIHNYTQRNTLIRLYSQCGINFCKSFLSIIDPRKKDKMRFFPILSLIRSLGYFSGFLHGKINYWLDQ